MLAVGRLNSGRSLRCTDSLSSLRLGGPLLATDGEVLDNPVSRAKGLVLSSMGPFCDSMVWISFLLPLKAAGVISTPSIWDGLCERIFPQAFLLARLAATSGRLASPESDAGEESPLLVFFSMFPPSTPPTLVCPVPRWTVANQPPHTFFPSKPVISWCPRERR